MNKAALNEIKVYLYSHPFSLLFAEAAKFFGSVIRVPGLGYIVNDPSVASEILARGEEFNKSGPGSMGAMITQLVGDYALLNMDGDEHRRLRDALKDLFSPSSVRKLVNECFSEELEQLRTDLLRQRTVDLVEFTQYVTGKLIYRLLGARVPTNEDGRDFYRTQYRTGQRLVEFMRLTAKTMSDKQVAKAKRQFERLVAPVMASYAESGVPEGSIGFRLKNMGLNIEKIQALVAIFLMVGTESVTTAVPRITAILIDSGGMADLRKRPDLLPSAIDEGLRMVVPSPAMLRSVTKDCEVQGYRFKANKRVVLLSYNMMKNRTYYPNPRKFVLGRSPEPATNNLWFGAGPHFCLGFSVALAEIQSILSVITGLPGPVRIVDRKVDRGALLPAYEKLTIAMSPG